MRRAITLIGIACIFLPLCGATQTTISGTVVNKKMEPLTGVNVFLLKSSDSSLVKGSGTNRQGSFSFENVRPGNYLIHATHVGYAGYYLAGISITHTTPNVNLNTVVLVDESAQLREVTVQARRPMIEQRIDRTVINVRNSISAAGFSALDVLERSPGVVVNRQANLIAMSGKEGVMVMINGKINYMPVAGLVQMLSGMSAGNIDRIELITTPPSNLDAEGNAGYINIVLISNPDFGFNGSLSASMGYGQGEMPAASVNFNYRKDRTNLYGDYSFSLDGRKPVFGNYRRVVTDRGIHESHIFLDRYPERTTHNARVGLDYQVSKKLLLGFLMSAYINRYSMESTTTTRNFLNSQPDTVVVTTATEVNNWRHAMANANLQYTFKAGEKISFDADYLLYDNDQPFEYFNHYYNAQGQLLFNEDVRTGKKTPIKFVVSKIDYTKSLGKKISMEAGIKVTTSTFDNDVTVDRFQGNVWKPDLDYTSFAMLKESIFAGYTSYAITPDAKTNVKLGLRYEYTNSNLGTRLVKDIVDRHYGRLFPSLFVSRKISDDKTVNFSYSRRIERPTFNDMAPFIFFFDPNTFISGNASLQPAISETIKGDFILDKNLFSVSYTYDDNSIAAFQSRIDQKTGKQVFFAENLNNMQTVSLVASIPLEPTRWWSTQTNLTGTWQQASTTYLNAPVKIQQANLNARTTQLFQLPKNFSFEITAFYQSTSIYGRFKVEPYWKLDMGIQKKFKKNNERLRFAVQDIFSTYKYVWVTNVDKENYSRTTLQYSRITATLTYSRNFGRSSVKAAQERSGGSAEERGRIQ